MTVKGYLPINDSLGDLVKMVRERLTDLAFCEPGFGPLELATGTVNDGTGRNAGKSITNPRG